MSRQSTSKDNAVMERFVRMFKQHKIAGIKIQNKLDAEMFYNPQFLSFRKLISKYGKRLNKKTFPETPQRAYKQNKTASLLMSPRIYTKALSVVYGDDPRLIHVNQYKQEIKETHETLEEVAAIKAELVNQTPIEIVDKKIDKLLPK